MWTTCLLFYQSLLFLGYVYGHLGRRLPPRRQAALHLLLLAATLPLLPVAPSAAWRPLGPEHPVPHLLGLLAVTVGAPYLLLAGTTPLLHDWFAREPRGRSPYHLYAISNAGSLLALLAYPSLVEPLLPVHAQEVVWSWGYGVFVLGMAVLAWARSGRLGAASAASAVAPRVSGSTAAPAARPSPGDVLHWLSLAACGSGLLMALTNAITMDVASVPLLWIAPLAVYLVTIVLAFAGVYRRETWGALLVLSLGAAALLWSGGFALPVAPQVVLACGVLFVGCMVCHGELAGAAPRPEHLTAFYLAMAGGGAVGGLLVAVVAPALLTDFYELPAFMLLAFALLLVSMYRDPDSVLRGRWRRPVGVLLVCVLLLATGGFAVQGRNRTRGTVTSVRNFYGVLRVQDRPQGELHDMRVLRHGRIFHGARFLDPARREAPTLYFTAGSGLEEAVRTVRGAADTPLRIGVIGLGVGTIAAWCVPGDTVRFYEINPAAYPLARRYFDFLADTPAHVEVTAGDGRIALERDVAQAGGRPLYDLLVVDAFAGDAVPVHLLTREAMQVYVRSVAPQGMVVFQITNRHVELGRVVRGLAADGGLQAVRVDQDPTPSSGGVANSWMLVARPGTPLPPSRLRDPDSAQRPPVLWTDDYSNLVGVLR